MRLPAHAALASAFLALLPLAGCGASHNPDTYAPRAVQQANRVEQGQIVGVRQVRIAAGGETGAAAGAAAGGVLGAQAPGGIFAALGGVSGAMIGGLAGNAAEHRLVDTTAWEYVVRIAGKPDLVSVTQRDPQPLSIGQRVLVIAGNQARIVADYTVATTLPAPSAEPPATPRLPQPGPGQDAVAPALPLPAGPPAGPPAGQAMAAGAPSGAALAGVTPASLTAPLPPPVAEPVTISLPLPAAVTAHLPPPLAPPVLVPAPVAPRAMPLTLSD